MPEMMTVRGDLELWARIRLLAEPDDVEWVNIGQDLDTWPGAREAARRRMLRGAGPSARKLFSAAVLADERDREALREMADHGMRVRIAATPLPRGTIIIDRRTMVLAGPAAGVYTVSVAPELVGGAYALFEAVWETATELAAFLAPGRPRLDGQARLVLRALGSGSTDEAAARGLGMSLRTYRRRVAELLAVLGAGSRFQAGVRAAELGLTRPGEG